MKNVKNVKRIITIGIATVLVVALSIGLMIGLAEDSNAYRGQSEYVCQIDADKMTNNPPYASAGVTGGFGDLDSNGRVWVDKSVQANAESNAFDVTLSALAQEYSYSDEVIQTIMEQNAADVLFVLDFSSSMTTSMDGSNRIKVLASSLNDAMKKVMDANPKNRIMAVAFDAGSYDFFPLGSYGANDSGNFVEYFDGSSKGGIKMCSGVTKDGASANYSLALGSGTHMQIGITYGCNALIQSMDDGFGDEGKRMPFVMVMTDGSSTKSNDNWAGYNLPSQNTNSNQIEANSTLAATFWKKRLIDAYTTRNAENGFHDDVEAIWFNIGMGIGVPTDAKTASRQQVSLKPEFASPAVTTKTAAAYNIYNNIISRLEKAYNNPENYVGDPLSGYDDLLARAGINIKAIRAAADAAVGVEEAKFNEKLADPNSDESKAIEEAGTKAKNTVLDAAKKSNFSKTDDYYKYIKTTYKIDHGKSPYKNAKNDDQYDADVKKAVDAAAEKAESDAKAAKKQELYNKALDGVEEAAIVKALEDQGKTEQDLTDAVQGYFEEFIKVYMGYSGDTQAERKANYESKHLPNSETNLMHAFAEYVNYADTAKEVEGSFNDLANLIAAATQGTVIPITHKETAGVGEDEIFITFVDPLGAGTELKKDADGNYVISLTLQDRITKETTTYTGRPKAGATEGVYEFYSGDKTLNSTVTIADDTLTWEVNAYELPIIRFLNRMKPTEGVKGKYFEDPDLPPILLNYQVVPTVEALANTSVSENKYIYEHDYETTGSEPSIEILNPAKAFFTPTYENTYYFTENKSTTPSTYDPNTSLNGAIDKENNKSKTADFVTSSAWGTGDDENDFVILLGNDARTKVLAEVSIEDDRPEDTEDYKAHEYYSDEPITYTLKVKNLSGDELKNLTYTLNVNPSGPTTSDTPSALTIGTCSTEPNAISTDTKTLTWKIDKLDAGATETVTVTMTPAKGTKNGTNVDAVISLTQIFGSDLAIPATDETGETILAENAKVNTYLDNTKKNIGTGTGAIPGSPSVLYIKKDSGDYIALSKSNTGVYSVSNIPVGEYTIYDGNSGTPNVLGKVTVTKGGTNEGNVYWKTINMEKVWDDNSNQDGKRPNKVTFNLKKKTGESTTADVASYDITGTTWKKSAVVLEKDENGNSIEYVLTETAIEGYEATVDGFKVTNKHTPEVKSITVTKVWDDADFIGKTGYIRPSVEIALIAKVDNVKVDSLCKTATLTASDVNAEDENEWLYTFTNLPVYSGGKTIAYTISETALAAYKTPIIDNANYKITNTPKDVSEAYNPLILPLIKVDYHYTNAGLKDAVITATATGITIVSAPTDADGISALTFEKPEYYSVVETTPPTGYMLNKAAYLVVVDKSFNSMAYDTTSGKWVWTYDLVLDSEQSPRLIGGKLRFQDRPIETSVVLKKVWDDNSDQDGKRPDSVKLTLYKTVNNVTTEVKDVTISKPATFSNTWTYTEEKLPTYEGGYPVTYTVEEKIVNVDSNYTNADSDLTDQTVTNKHVPETTSVTVKKVWDDASNQDGKRTANVTLTLYKQVEGGTKTKVDDYILNGTGNEWTKTISNLPKYQDGGKLIIYTADELAANVPTGYTKSAEGLIVTNKYTPETTSVTVKKVWDDASNQDGIRPDDVTLTLYKTVDGSTGKVDDYTFSGEGNEWTKEITNLPVYEAGKEITYTVGEETVPEGYSKENVDATTIKNSYTPATTSITLKKQWNDNSDQDGLRPDEITLRLNKTVGGKTDKVGDYTFSGEGDNWTKEITGLPVYEAGSKINYTADEPTVPNGYDKATDGLAVRNSHTPEVTDVTVKKIWDDQNDIDEIRPEEVTLTLYKTVNGVTDKVGDIILDETDGSGNTWEWTEEKLPVYEDGYKITYTVDELNVPTDYTKTIDDLTVKNSHGPVRNVYVTYSEGGSISNGNAEVVYGGSYQTIATPDDGYVIDTVTINDVKVPRRDDGTYKIEDITEDQYIVISFAEDRIGGGDDLDEGDGIPDKYQATVTYKVVNGTWADDSADPIKKVFDMATNTTGAWENVTPTPTLGATVPTGMKPDEKHITNNAAWDKTCTADVTVVDGSVYTYTFPDYLKHRIDISVTNGTKDITEDYVLVIHKDDQSMSFAPNTGYALDTVTVDGEPAVLKADGSYDFTTVIADHEIVVVYATDVIGGGDDLDEPDGIPDKYQAIVTYKVVNGTWADGNDDDIDALFNTHIYQDGVWTALNPTLGTTVPTGMLPDDIHIAPGSWDKTTTSSVAVVDKDVFTFTFDQYLTFDITINVTGGTHDAGDDEISVIHKDSKTIQFTPDDGKVIKSVVIDGVEVAITDDLTYTFDNVSADHTITVVFVDDKNNNGIPDEFEADITYKVVNGTWEDETADDIVEHFILKELKEGFWVDTNATLGTTIPVGMLPDDFHLTDDSAWSSDIESTTAVTGNATYVFSFGEEKYHNITIDITGGSTDPDEEIIPVKHKDGKTVVIIPDNQHIVDKIIINGEEVEIPDDLTLKFDEVVDDMDIQVICEEDLNGDNIADKYQAKVTIVENEVAGKTSGEGIFIKGDTVTVVSTLNDGYKFIGWMVDGKIVSTDLEYSFSLNNDVKLVPVYEKIVIPETTTTTTTKPDKKAPVSPDTSDAAGPVAGILLAVFAAAWLMIESRKKTN